MERRQRGRDTEWSDEEMDRWLGTPEDDPDSCSSESLLTDFAPDDSAEDSDGIDEPHELRRECCRDIYAPTNI